MKSLLTEEFYKLGFLCGIEQEIYIRDTGNYTSLIIEGERKGGDGLYSYDFYKQTFYPHYPNKVTVYRENLPAPLLLKRVRQYLFNREQYIKEQQTSK